jgi:hypothetical protein
MGSRKRCALPMSNFLLVLLSAVTVIGTVAAAEGDESVDDVKCEALGFTGLALCSDCDSLAEYVKDQGNCLVSGPYCVSITQKFQN